MQGTHQTTSGSDTTTGGTTRCRSRMIVAVAMRFVNQIIVSVVASCLFGHGADSAEE